MRKALVSLLIAFLSLALLAPALRPAHAATVADWTFLVYLDGDNNLDPYGVLDVKELERVGSSARVNVLVLLDRYEDGATLYYVTKDNSDEIGSRILADWGEVNMGDPATLRRFIDFACKNYPARNVLLDLWDHGGGWRGVCWDDHDTVDDGWTDRLTMDEVQQAIGNRRLAIISSDSCLLGGVEVAYEWSKQAEVFVGSEELTPGYGWQYETVLAALVAKPTMTPSELGAVLVEKYIECYGENSFVTLAAIDMAKLPGIKDSVDALARTLMANPDRGAVAGAQGDAQSYGMGGQGYPFIDLAGFADALAAKTGIPAVRAAAVDVAAAVRGAVLAEAHGQSNHGSNGLSIFLPVSEPNYQAVYGDRLDFTSDGLWDEFLVTFYSKWR